MRWHQCNLFIVFFRCSNILKDPFASLPDDVQMIYVCRITDISQTTCILRSIHARVLQLLRDGASEGRTSRTHGQTLSIFPPLWFSFSLVSLTLSRSAEMVWSLAGDPPSQHRPLWLPGLVLRQHFAVFFPHALVILSIYSPDQNISSKCSFENGSSRSSFSCLSFGSDGCLWRTAGLQQIRQLYWRRKARRPTEKQHIHHTGWWENVITLRPDFVCFSGKHMVQNTGKAKCSYQNFIHLFSKCDVKSE